MSTSASTSSGGKVPLPGTDVINGWDTDEVVDFLRKQGLRLSESHFQILHQEEIDGSAFLDLSQEDLQASGFQLGPAKNIIKLIKEIKDAQEGKYHDCVHISSSIYITTL